MTTRTEYAILYTTTDGTVTIDPHVTPTGYDDPEACQRVGDLGDWQEEMGIPVDACIVSRTVTATDWAEPDPIADSHTAAVHMTGRSHTIAERQARGLLRRPIRRRTYTGTEMAALMQAFVKDALGGAATPGT